MIKSQAPDDWPSQTLIYRDLIIQQHPYMSDKSKIQKHIIFFFTLFNCLFFSEYQLQIKTMFKTHLNETLKQNWPGAF